MFSISLLKVPYFGQALDLKRCDLSEALRGKVAPPEERGVAGLNNKYEISEKLTIKSVLSVNIKLFIKNLRTAEATRFQNTTCGI